MGHRAYSPTSPLICVLLVHAVPMATYILGPSTTEHAQFYSGVGSDGGELCTNVVCLGQRGVYTTSSGLQVAYLSGLQGGRGEVEEGKLVSAVGFLFKCIFETPSSSLPSLPLSPSLPPSPLPPVDPPDERG